MEQAHRRSASLTDHGSVTCPITYLACRLVAFCQNGRISPLPHLVLQAGFASCRPLFLQRIFRNENGSYGLRATCMAGFEEISVPLVHDKGMSQPHRETHDRAEGCANQLVHARLTELALLPLRASNPAVYCLRTSVTLAENHDTPLHHHCLHEPVFFYKSSESSQLLF